MHPSHGYAAPFAGASSAQSPPPFYASRKCGRREEGEGEGEGGGVAVGDESRGGFAGTLPHPTPRELSPPPPLMHLHTYHQDYCPPTAATGATPPAVQGGSGGGWGASLSPRGYTAAQRTVHATGVAEAAPMPIGGATCERLATHAAASARHHFWKRRRTELVHHVSLQKEVFMYLDAVSATQEQLQQHTQHNLHHDPSRRGTGAEEDEVTHDDASSATTAFSSHTSRHARGASVATLPAPPSPPSPPLTSVDAAVRETVRVLQACWDEGGAARDAFEPVRLLSPVALHLLVTYGHHTLTADGQYVVLRGGTGQLPWVGCLYGILLAYLYRDRTPSSPASAAGGISRLLVLNCHCFGWLDHVGSDEYERSHRRLYQAREALVGLLEDPRYAAVGRPLRCPMCSSSVVGGDAHTLVVLGDTIVMEGGAPSLGLASSRNTFTAHHQYGRGIACCVPELSWPAPGGRAHGSGAVRTTALCHAHRPAAKPGAMAAGRSVGSYAPQSPVSGVVEESPVHTPPSREGRSHAWFAPSHPATEQLPAVCCGVCRAAGVLGQAVLLGPTGPLILHVQFDEREWLEAAARCGAVPSSSMPSWLAAATAASADVITAVCAPSPAHAASRYAADPALAMAAVLYAVLQGDAGGTSASAAARRASVLGGVCGAGFTPQHAGVAASVISLTPVAGGTVALGEFVEWLVRLLLAPPPALVVEWHAAGPLAHPTTAMGVTEASMLPRSSGNQSPPLADDSCGGTCGSSSHSGAVEGEGCASPSASASHVSVGAAPLGMTTQPRRPAVLQLLEVYADVVQSRARLALSASPPTTRSSTSGAAEVALLLEQLEATREALQPCVATQLFDGVERPLVLTKGVEVAAEAERFLQSSSVATSLQFRHSTT